MEKYEIGPGMVRVRLTAEDGASFASVDFADGSGTFMTQTGFSCRPRPVYRTEPGTGETGVLRTANGETTRSGGGEIRLLRTVHSAELTFACPEGEILTGLGQHEDGIFDYARREERLYQHNMKIAVPFLLSGAGWGLLIEAGCAMRYEGSGDGFTFTLDAVSAVSYVVIRAENCAGVLKKLSSLTGRPALLPKWAYGYIQSKERYRTAEELTETAAEFRRRGLGLDCVVLDWCSWRDGCWGDKTPDPERFPDVRALTGTLHGMNARLMVSVWPNTVKGRDHDEFLREGFFLPGTGIYDAFRAEARDLYWRQCRRFWMDGGADALWCDSCEPVTDPDWCGDTKRDADERMRLITEASALCMDPEDMNDYGTVHLRGLYEHWRRDFPDKRPVLLARSGGPGSGAMGAILWSGDISARWDVLRAQVTEAIRAACSGICWWTLDTGAFFVDSKEPWFWRGDYPDGVADPGYRELYLRWLQFGAMLPVFRSHGTDTPREPWRFGPEDSADYERVRGVIALRYRLLPYIYSAAAQACREGLPMIRAMLTAFPEEPSLHRTDDQYMLGDALLVKPVTRSAAEGGGVTEVALPAGGWFDWFTRVYFSGGGRVAAPTPPERFPLFVRAGSIVPVAEDARCAEDLPVPARELLVFGGADGELLLYDDAGDGYAAGISVPVSYRDGDALLTLGRAEGTLPEPVSVLARHIRPDGTEKALTVRYDGGETRVSLA